MRKSMATLMMVLLSLGFSTSASATLIDNNDGTVTQVRDDPAYGDGSTLMWLKDANTPGYGMTWQQATDWIASLNNSDYLGYDDWRLPHTHPVNGANYNHSFMYDGSSDRGYHIRSPNSEMAYMFYVELGNTGQYDTAGHHIGYPDKNNGPFINWEFAHYWSSTEVEDRADLAWYFAPGDGLQDYFGKDTTFGGGFVWAVRDDVEPVPEPATMLLLGSGLVGLAGFRRKFGSRN